MILVTSIRGRRSQPSEQDGVAAFFVILPQLRVQTNIHFDLAQYVRTERYQSVQGSIEIRARDCGDAIGSLCFHWFDTLVAFVCLNYARHPDRTSGGKKGTSMRRICRRMCTKSSSFQCSFLKIERTRSASMHSSLVAAAAAAASSLGHGPLVKALEDFDL